MTRKVSISVERDGVGAFFKRAHAHARLLDRGEPIPSEIAIIFENPVDMLRMLTKERVRLLDSLRDEGPMAISTLAVRLNRNRRAVSRDVSAMVAHGLVRTKYVTNAGHGRNLVVMPSAKRLELKAAI